LRIPSDSRRQKSSAAFWGLAHNIDFELIEDPKQRAISEARSLRLARAMMVDVASFPTIGAVTKAAREVRDWQPDFAR
jgi:5-methylthioribose kinase